MYVLLFVGLHNATAASVSVLRQWVTVLDHVIDDPPPPVSCLLWLADVRIVKDKGTDETDSYSTRIDYLSAGLDHGGVGGEPMDS